MQVLAVYIDIADIDTTLRFYDAIEVQKSSSGPPSYADARSVTTSRASGAVIIGTATGPYLGVNGAMLSLSVDGTLAVETFTDPDPNTITSVVRQLGDLTLVAASNDGSGHLKLQTISVGSGARLTLLDGSVNLVLGLTSGTTAYGTDKHIDLLSGVSKYVYTDLNGSGYGYYRYRPVNLSTGEAGDYSSWFPGPGNAVIHDSDLIVGEAYVAGLVGDPMEGMRITVVNVYNPLVKDSFLVAGSSVTASADSTGRVSFNLIRGSQVDVILEGTSIIRRITVPTIGTSFNLLDPSLQVDDAFGIQVPDLPAAVRHS